MCNKCKSVLYCNAVCKKVHKKKHRKACDRRVAEVRDIELFKHPPPLHLLIRRAAELQEEENKRVAELHDIELFKQPPPENDCPICFLQLPYLGTGSALLWKVDLQWMYSCCG